MNKTIDRKLDETFADFVNVMFILWEEAGKRKEYELCDCAFSVLMSVSIPMMFSGLATNQEKTKLIKTIKKATKTAERVLFKLGVIVE